MSKVICDSEEKNRIQPLAGTKVKSIYLHSDEGKEGQDHQQLNAGTIIDNYHKKYHQ